MDPPKKDSPKLPDMVMCGDHPSFTKTELNMKESKIEDKEKRVITYSNSRMLPSSSRTNGSPAISSGECRSQASEHGLRLGAGRRRVRSLDEMPRQDDANSGNRALVQAALGSFRWPPYLLAVWVVVLILTHVLHCIVTMLEKALPNIRKFCHYFRAWTEETWKQESDMNHRFCPVALAFITGLLYTVYFGLFVIYSVALWSVEPLCADLDDKQSATDVMEKVTDYIEDSPASITNIKH